MAHACDPVRTLLSTYLFQDLNPAELEPLVRVAGVRSYEKGEYVFRVGDPADRLHVVALGQVKYSVTTPEGDEFVNEILGPGAVFGEPGLFAVERNRVVDAVAMVGSEVVEIGRERLVDFLQAHRPALMRMLEGLASDARSSVETLVDVGFGAIRERVARKLVEMAITHGRQLPDGSVEIALMVNQTTLAGLVAATRENVNRAMAALASEGDVRTEGGRVVLPDLERLQRKADRGFPPLQRRNVAAED